MERLGVVVKRGIFLTVVVFAAHHFSGFLEAKVVSGEPFAWGWIALWYFAWLTLGDQLIQRWLE